jgi:hypothetical protein
MKKLKKLFIPCLLILVLSFTSCTGVKTINPDRLKIDKAYSFNVNIQYGNNNAVAEFRRAGTDMWEVILKEPYALEGMSVIYANGIITAAYENLQGSFDENGSSVYLRIITAFENAVNGEGREVVASGDVIKITSKAGTPVMSYELVLDRSNYEPLSLKISQASLSAEFSDVQVSQIVPVMTIDG